MMKCIGQKKKFPQFSDLNQNWNLGIGSLIHVYIFLPSQPYFCHVQTLLDLFVEGNVVETKTESK